MKKIILSLIFISSFLFGGNLINNSNEFHTVVYKINKLVYENRNLPYENFCFSSSKYNCFNVQYTHGSSSDYPTFTISENFKNPSGSLVSDSSIKEPIKIFVLLIKDDRNRNNPVSHPYLFLETNELISINHDNFKDYENQIIFLLEKYYEFLNNSFSKFKEDRVNSLIDLKNIK